jgi:hypothetical protein
MKQTAVEWLFLNLKSHFEHDGDLLEVVQFSFEQAKEMEKEQIRRAFCHGEVARDRIDSIEYYNETYGK